MGNVPEKEEEKKEYVHRVGRYTYEILYSYSDARKYYEYTEPGAWCITYGQQHYDYYVRTYNIHYVIFVVDGYENVERKVGPGFSRNKPHDEYGNSMIALLQSNRDGSPFYITSRWNHGYGETQGTEADHAYTKEEFFQITGMDDAKLKEIFQEWKENRTDIDDKATTTKADRLPSLRKLKYIQMKLNGGEGIMSVFSDFPTKSGKILKGDREAPDKAILGFKVNIDDFYYSFIMDRKQIVFDTLTVDETTSQAYGTQFYCPESQEDSRYRGYNNIVAIKLPDERMMLYDMRRHQVMSIGGIKKFKKISTAWEKKGKFYQVMMTKKQRALVDFATNTPITLPNGSQWMEDIETLGVRQQYGRELEADIVPENAAVIKIVYDSSSGEKYFYDISIRSFIRPNEDPFDRSFPNMDNIDVENFDTLSGIYFICHHQKVNISWNGKKYACGSCRSYVFKGGKQVSDEVITDRTSVEGIGGTDWFLRYEGIDTEHKYLYNFLTGQKITIPAPYVSLHRSCYRYYGASHSTRKDFIIFEVGGRRFTNGGGHDCVLIFDTIDNKFLANPARGDNFFEVYDISFGDSGFHLFFERGGKKFTLVHGRGIVPLEEPSVATVNESQIRRMVKESVRKFLQRG